MTFAYDAGVLIAADCGDRELWAIHRAQLELGIAPLTTAPIVAQVSRSPRQAGLHGFLRGCDVVAFASDVAQAVGSLAGSAARADVIDAHLVLVAAAARMRVLTGDVRDLEELAARLPSGPGIVAI